MAKLPPARGGLFVVLLEAIKTLAMGNQPGQFSDKFVIKKRAESCQGFPFIVRVERDNFPSAPTLVVPLL